MKRRRARLLAAVTLGSLVLALSVLAVAVVRTPLPEALRGHAPASVRVLDRGGQVLREVRTDGHQLTTPVKLGELSPHVVPALLAAEDARFFAHPGVDPLAILRAATQMVRAGHVVSGASTLTQQLARTVVPRPRTVSGKVREMLVALRIERELDKTRILEEYLSRVPFGPNVRGIEAASRLYLDKPARDLDLAEAALLVAIPRGPSLYDPRKSPTTVLRRRDRVLERMRNRGLAAGGTIDQALATRVHVQRPSVSGSALHLALATAAGQGLPAALRETGAPREIQTTIDAALQARVETLTRRVAHESADGGPSALSVVVVENATGDVLAYVGSPDYFAVDGHGANDGARALRQPGSTLKPFVYAAGMEGLGMTAATVLPDVELVIETEAGPYRPRNYDGRFHGPVLLREALAGSLNVPAVHVAAAVGPGRVLEMLRRAGFASLTAGADHYGAAIALGDGEVRLLELAEAYVMLARSGERVPVSTVRGVTTTSGKHVDAPRATRTRVLDPRTASLLTHILADDVARAASFGRDGALTLPFPVAAKTGTSKGYRDNWTVGFTREVTVAVWAGHFDGSPMAGSSGITGAAPLFHEVILAAMEGRPRAPLVNLEGLVSVEICAESGERPGTDCPHRVHELFRTERAPAHTCTFHVHAVVDAENGLLSLPGCPGATERVLERHAPSTRIWAAAAGRPLLPSEASPRCPDAAHLHAPLSAARIRFPRDGARFLIDPGARARQEIVLAAEPGNLEGALRFVLDGRPIGVARAPFELPWALTPGEHRLEVQGVDRARASGSSSRPVRFVVAGGG